ncbi:MAG: extracellular solute-binding protein [Anaerolineae bacterium]|nr:extracellular solute-binding protein [Anaerolineae bacterium]MEB2288799.1 substrate-binding domain-containing protein [Anaerolineae bacterium]
MMSLNNRRMSRRNFLKGAAASGVLLASTPGVSFAEKVSSIHFLRRRAQIETITILINDSPWFPGFEALVKQYVETTGNDVKLNVTPFAGMLEKSRNAVQGSESEFDILNLNEQWYMQFYAGGLVTPIHDINPDFELDPNVIEYDAATRWDESLRYSSPDGALYGLPINGNIQLFFYRQDLFDEKGLAAPTTWDEVESIAQTFHNPPGMHGFSLRTIGGNWEFQAYLHSYGTSAVSLDLASGEWMVGLADPGAVEALKTWLRLGREYGPANINAMGQAENLALMASGRLAQVHMVGAAAPNYDNPDTSVVVGKMGAGVVPGGPGGRATLSGIWVMGIPHNLSDVRKASALAFLEWALTKDAQLYYAQSGAIPVRQDVYEALSEDPKLGWWMKAMGESTPFIKAQPRLAETPQIVEVIDRRTTQALIDELTPEEAMAEAAKEIHQILVSGGYTVKPLA